MNYGHPELRERLAAEYAMGLLRGQARRRFERLLRGDLALRALVQDWEMRVNLLAESAPAQVPPARLWPAIEQRLGIAGAPAASPVQAAPPLAAATGWWNVIGFWRPFGVAAAVAAVVLAVFVALRPPSLTPQQIADIDQRLSGIEDKLASVEATPGRIGEMNQRLARIESGTESLAKTPGEIAALDQRLAGIETKLAAIEATPGELAALDERLARIESGTASLAGTPSNLAALNERLAGIENRLSVTAPPPSHVAVLLDKEGRPMMVADLDVVDGRLVLRLNITPPRDFTGKTLEVWEVPPGGTPRSLGLFPSSKGGTVTVLVLTPELARSLATSALAVSLEPSGGSTTGLPTGPVLFSGAVVPVDL